VVLVGVQILVVEVRVELHSKRIIDSSISKTYSPSKSSLDQVVMEVVRFAMHLVECLEQSVYVFMMNVIDSAYVQSLTAALLS
jgi:hypothetical protein